MITHIVMPLGAPASIGLYAFMFDCMLGCVDFQEVPRQLLMAGAVIITAPIVVLFFWFEKYLVGGLTAGGVKQ